MEWVGADQDIMFSSRGQEIGPPPHQIITLSFKESHFAVKHGKQTHSSPGALGLTFALRGPTDSNLSNPILSFPVLKF